ncbi:Ulp1-like peptidase [Cucumis melo var. makuwa]|uniref:Ulp1-like peptidase n=1 Tax=Cucumis melo var. makuwa TaxID=1194695 RepID=A0A5D3CAE0_CUCMM|nr:Ulp1-like peptidase [Cucumis melo var. makuwa]TYK08320.1 Ulp1-like peptidase [Cucumis melo var. makuwa]
MKRRPRFDWYDLGRENLNVIDDQHESKRLDEECCTRERLATIEASEAFKTSGQIGGKEDYAEAKEGEEDFSQGLSGQALPHGRVGHTRARKLWRHTTMKRARHSTKINMKPHCEVSTQQGRVDDEEVFKNFNWSTFFYIHLLNSLKTSLQGKKEAYKLKKTKSSKAVTYYNIKGYVHAFQVWTYEALSTASEHLATKNNKELIPRILRWNCTQAPSYKMLQKNIFDNKNTVVKPKLKLSTQEKAFMGSRIRWDDNMEMENDESIPDINNSNTNTPDDAMNNQPLEQSDSSPQLSPQRKQSQTVANESEMHPITNKKRCRLKKSNDKEQQSHLKSYKKLKNEIKEVHKDLSTLTSTVSRMDDTIRKQSLELSEMKQMLERLVQGTSRGIR